MEMFPRAGILQTSWWITNVLDKIIFQNMKHVAWANICFISLSIIHENFIIMTFYSQWIIGVA